MTRLQKLTAILEREIHAQLPNAVIHGLWYDDEAERWVLEIDNAELHFDVGSDDDRISFYSIEEGDYSAISFDIPADWPTE